MRILALALALLFPSLGWAQASGSVAGNVLATGSNPQVQINLPVGNFRSIEWQTSGSPRWDFTTNNTAESGSNVGSNFTVTRFSDAGSPIDSPLVITRSTGYVSLADVATIGSSQNALCITSGGAIQQQASSCIVSGRQYKTDIAPLTHGLDWIARLTPSTYAEKATGQPMIGLIADDAGAIDTRLADYGTDGKVQTIQPEAVLAVLTKAVQQQQAEIEALQRGHHRRHR